MPRRCTVCADDQRSAIEREILAGKPIRAIASRYAPTRHAITRHRAHVAERLGRASGAAEVTSADKMLAKIHQLEEDARRIGRAAEREGDHRAAIAAIRELVRIVELVAKLTGDLKPEIPQGGYVIVFEGGVPKALPEATAAIETTAIERSGNGA